MVLVVPRLGLFGFDFAVELDRARYLYQHFWGHVRRGTYELLLLETAVAAIVSSTPPFHASANKGAAACNNGGGAAVLFAASLRDQVHKAILSVQTVRSSPGFVFDFATWQSSCCIPAIELRRHYAMSSTTIALRHRYAMSSTAIELYPLCPYACATPCPVQA